MKELAYVLDRRMSANISPDLGDFVTCCNCGRTMLVNIGTDSCPECEEHALMWADRRHQKVNENFFEKNPDYLLVDTE